MPGEEDLIWSVYSIFIVEMIFKSCFDLLDIVENVKRHVFAPRAKTQEDMNNCMSGRQLDLSERYTVSCLFSLLYFICS